METIEYNMGDWPIRCPQCTNDVIVRDPFTLEKEKTIVRCPVCLSNWVVHTFAFEGDTGSAVYVNFKKPKPRKKIASGLMITYLIKSGNLHKIGKTTDLSNRLSSYHTHNPDIELVASIAGDLERILHEKYKHKRVKMEWFKLTKKDISNIISHYHPMTPEVS